MGRRRRRADVDIGFFAGADAVAGAVQCAVFLVSVEREVVKTAVGEAVAVVFRGLHKGVSIEARPERERKRKRACEVWKRYSITFCIVGPGDEVRFGKGRNRFVYTAAGSQV